MACGGAAAAFAVNFTHPIETVKTRMQASGGSIGATMSGVMKEGGVPAFWKGLPFGWGRELSYTSVKLGACKFDAGGRILEDFRRNKNAKIPEDTDHKIRPPG